MTETLLQKLPYPLNKYDIDSVKKFYKDLDITTKFQLKPRTEDISKAAGIYNLPGRFLNDGESF